MTCLVVCYLFGIIMYLVGLVMDMLISHEEEPILKLIVISLIWPIWFVIVMCELIVQAVTGYREG